MKIRLHIVLVLLACFALTGCITRTSPQELPATSTPSQMGSQPAVDLPLKPKSVRFAVIGDSGTGDRAQFEVAREMEVYRKAVDFTFVLMLGDNIYGGDRPADFAKKI